MKITINPMIIIYPNSKVNSILNNSDSMEFYELNEPSNDNTTFLISYSTFSFLYK